MDLLQVGLIFLIALLSIFLSVTGFYVFLILKDMKRSLDKLNQILFYDSKGSKVYEERVEDSAAGLDKLRQAVKKAAKPASPRFFKKTL